MRIDRGIGEGVGGGCEKYFIKHMDAQMVLEAPQSKKVIPEHIERKIMEANTGHKKQVTSYSMLINPVAGVEVLYVYVCMYECIRLMYICYYY